MIVSIKFHIFSKANDNISLLLQCGDIEVNPGPLTKGKYFQVKCVRFYILVVNALFQLEFEWSDIENYLIANQNWRYPNSFWGKLSKVVFGRNRARQRAKIMNLWRANRTKIHLNS